MGLVLVAKYYCWQWKKINQFFKNNQEGILIGSSGVSGGITLLASISQRNDCSNKLYIKNFRNKLRGRQEFYLGNIHALTLDMKLYVHFFYIFKKGKIFLLLYFRHKFKPNTTRGVIE